MSKKRKSKLVRVSARDLPPRSPEDLARLEAACSGPIDTSGIPEITQEDFQQGRLHVVKNRRIPVTLRLDRDIASQVLSEDPDQINQVLREHLAKRKAG